MWSKAMPGILNSQWVPSAEEIAEIERHKAELRAEYDARPVPDQPKGSSRRFWIHERPEQPTTPAAHARRAILEYHRAMNRLNGTHGGPRAPKASRYKGVCHDAKNRTKPWFSSISVNGKPTRLGSFATEEEAARAYDRARVEAGFAPVNFPDDTPSEPAIAAATPAIATNGPARRPGRPRSAPAVPAEASAVPPTASALRRELVAAAAIADALGGLDEAGARRVLGLILAHYPE